MISNRLKFTKISETDTEHLNKIYANKNLVRYFVSGPDKSIDETEKRLKKIINHWDTYNFGDFLVYSLESNCLIGFGGLHYKEIGGKVNISYIVLEDYQGKGFGLEISRTLLKYGFEKLKLSEIVAEIDPENEASKCLITKCGFKYNSTINYKGFERLEYIMKNENIDF